MITHAELFNRVAESYDFGALWTIEAQIEKDLDAALEDYQQAVTALEVASDKLNRSAEYDFEYDLAYINVQKKYLAYLEKHMLHSAFHGYYKKS